MKPLEHQVAQLTASMEDLIARLDLLEVDTAAAVDVEAVAQLLEARQPTKDKAATRRTRRENEALRAELRRAFSALGGRLKIAEQAIGKLERAVARLPRPEQAPPLPSPRTDMKVVRLKRKVARLEATMADQVGQVIERFEQVEKVVLGMVDLVT